MDPDSRFLVQFLNFVHSPLWVKASVSYVNEQLWLHSLDFIFYAVSGQALFRAVLQDREGDRAGGDRAEVT